MIRSMLEPSFSLYGRIEQTAPALKSGLQKRVLTGQEQVRLYRFAFDTVWDYDSGMTILLIQAQDGPICYYLDRTVTILAGVTFGFYPMEGESAILADPVLSASCTGICKPPELGAAVKPMRILTRFRQTGYGGLYFRGERHTPLELVYLEKGVLHNYCEGQEVVLHPGELLIFGSDQWHMQYANEDVQVLTVSFRWEDHDLSSWIGQIIPTTPEMRYSIHALLQTVEHADAEEYYHAHLKLLLIQILQQPFQQEKRKKPLPASEQAHRRILDLAMQSVSAGIFGRLDVPTLAASVNVSTSQLTALFQTYLRVSPAKYITRIRLEESKRLLTQGHMNVGEVAQCLHYSSMQHFSRQFHEWFGCTPTAFVKMQQDASL